MTISSSRTRNADGTWGNTWTTTIDEPTAPPASPISYSVVDKSSPVEEAAWKAAAAPTARETADAITTLSARPCVLGGHMTEIAPTVTDKSGGKQWVWKFANGYGASVIQNQYSYGGSAGQFELAVLHNGDLTYDTPITDDVIGHLDWSEVEELVDRIEALREDGTETVRVDAERVSEIES